MVRRRGCKEIATRLSISSATVKTHRKNSSSKFGLSGKVAFQRALSGLLHDEKIVHNELLTPKLTLWG